MLVNLLASLQANFESKQRITYSNSLTCDSNIYFDLKAFPYIVAKGFPVLGSHNLTGCWLSLLPDITRPLWGCQWTHFTSAPCPNKENKLKKLNITIRVETKN